MPSKLLTTAILLSTASLLTACDPEPGTPEWCEMIKEKPAGDITANEAAEFAKSCAGEELSEGLNKLLNGDDSNN